MNSKSLNGNPIFDAELEASRELSKTLESFSHRIEPALSKSVLRVHCNLQAKESS